MEKRIRRLDESESSPCFNCRYCGQIFRRESAYSKHKEECQLAPGSRFHKIFSAPGPPQNDDKRPEDETVELHPIVRDHF